LSRGPGFGGGLLAGAIVTLLALVLIAPLREAVLPESGPASRAEEALGVIEEAYFRDADVEKLENASINGMIRQLRRQHDDRFSHYFDPRTNERFEASTSGEFSGVGLTVSEVKRGLRVARVFEDTPAERAQIGIGDLIVSVDGESIAGESSTASAAMIKGPPGTEVELGVIDAKSGKRRKVTVERANVRIPAVDGEIRRRDGKRIAYVQLASFTRGAHGELRDLVERLYRRGAEALVLDLRGNGGGLLQEAILVTSTFQEEGPVVITEGRTRARETYEATGGALARRPMAVLVNGDTASASEIVAAALQQNGIARVYGERTFGKGTFQEIIQLDGGAALDLTVGEYLTADGSSILEQGVRPDVRAPDRDPTDGDRTASRALGDLAAEIDSD
jgi:carboxyl-terminal processing protease